MLQSATVAQSQGAPDAVVVAALLHDIGYFLYPESETSIHEGRNTEHEALGAAWLSRHFGPDVTAPVALCMWRPSVISAPSRPSYFEQLSGASRASLMVQGGIMREDEVAVFARAPGCRAGAVILRRADDLGKDPFMQTPPLSNISAP